MSTSLSLYQSRTDSTRSVYIETSADPSWKVDDEGIADYELSGTGSRFGIHYKFETVYVDFWDIDTWNAPKNQGTQVGPKPMTGKPIYWAVISEQWVSAGEAHGENGFHCFGLHGFDNWMDASRAWLGERNLRHICVAGTHDSAIYKMNLKTSLAGYGSIVMQTKTIEEQLQAGIRYSDVRPVKNALDSNCYVGHWTLTDQIGWQGGNGPLLSDIISQINNFTINHKELIVFRSSHDNTFAYTGVKDTGESALVPASDADWRNLVDILCGANGLNKRWNDSAALKTAGNDLTKVKLNEFIKESSAVVIIVKDDFDVKDETKYAGCFKLTPSWSMWDYSPWQESDGDRVDHFKQNARPAEKAYSYSLCHTQSPEEAEKTKAEESLGTITSLGSAWAEHSFLYSSSDYARNFFTGMFNEITPIRCRWPSAIAVDGSEGYAYAALEMAITDRIDPAA